ncbi:MAG TPA: DUF3592 domain-containing protein [Alphaproteobacteria bacterium]|nr:DUF3592 domain-containing protein [Alphaproteobacteria bacterium]
MTGWKAPLELDGGLPRQVKATGSFWFVLLVITLSFLPVFYVFVSTGYGKVYKLEILKERGVTVHGAVANLRIQSSKNGPLYYVDYQYKPADMVYSEGSNITGDVFKTLHIGQTITVIYDPLDQTRSFPNAGDLERSLDAAKKTWHMLVVFMFPLFGTFFVGAELFAFWTFSKQKKLLSYGMAAQATITGERQVNRGRSGVFTEVTYQFQDDSGNTVEGKRSDLPRQKLRDKGGKALAQWTKAMDNPTVLYMPGKSSVNLLYPPTMVRLQNDNRY